MAKKYVYSFGGGKADGQAAMKNLLGGKGANLAEMAGLGMPVPPGFTLTTEVCTYYYDHGRKYPAELKGQVDDRVLRVPVAATRRTRCSCPAGRARGSPCPA